MDRLVFAKGVLVLRSDRSFLATDPLVFPTVRWDERKVRRKDPTVVLENRSDRSFNRKVLSQDRDDRFVCATDRSFREADLSFFVTVRLVSRTVLVVFSSGVLLLANDRSVFSKGGMVFPKGLLVFSKVRPFLVSCPRG
jgi:hypothetical protein